jgi:hypothetical protein
MGSDIPKKCDLLSFWKHWFNPRYLPFRSTLASNHDTCSYFICDPASRHNYRCSHKCHSAFNQRGVLFQLSPCESHSSKFSCFSILDDVVLLRDTLPRQGRTVFECLVQSASTKDMEHHIPPAKSITNLIVTIIPHCHLSSSCIYCRGRIMSKMICYAEP